MWATLAGTVVAHRIFDLIPICLLVLYVLVTAKIPAWAYSIIVAVVSVVALSGDDRGRAAHARVAQCARRQADAVAAIKSGNSLLQATASQNPTEIGKTAVRVGYDIMNGKKPEKPEVLLASTLVTRDNAGSYKGW